MTTENVTRDAPRIHQAVFAHLLAWMVTGLLLFQHSRIPAWLPYVHSHTTLAQSGEGRVRRWMENPDSQPTNMNGPLVTRALRTRA